MVLREVKNGAVSRCVSGAGSGSAAGSVRSVQSGVSGSSTMSGPAAGDQSYPHTATTGHDARMPKVPRPDRTRLIVEAICDGLREYISMSEQEIHTLSSRDEEDTLTPALSQQLKTSQRQLKQLEFHLSKIEEIREQYLVQERLKEGAHQMLSAYLCGPQGGRTMESLGQVKSGVRECEQEMCRLEQSLQMLMGTLKFEIKGLVGFARLCPGDQYEIQVKYGSDQKWRARCKIQAVARPSLSLTTGGSGGRASVCSQQQWDKSICHMTCLIGDILNIKAVEHKGLGKQIVLGSKNCETKDFFSAHQQLMTINLNSTGSLKLNLYITWNPIDGARGNTETRGRRHKPSLSNCSSLSSLPSHLSPAPSGYNWTLRGELDRSDSGGGSSERSCVSAVSTVSRRLRESGVSGSRRAVSMYASQPSLFTTQHLTHHHQQQQQSCVDGGSVTTVSSLVGTTTTTDDCYGAVRSALSELTSTLEDYQGQYRQLQHLEQVVIRLSQFVSAGGDGGGVSAGPGVARYEEAAGSGCGSSDCTSGHGSPSSSNTNLRHSSPTSGTLGAAGASCDESVQDVLDCFDFLDDDDGSTSTLDRRHQERSAQRRSDDGGVDSGLESLCVRSKSGASTRDLCVYRELLYHVQITHKLLNELGSFGPLKCAEIKALHMLGSEAVILGQIMQTHAAAAQRNLRHIDDIRHVVYNDCEVSPMCATYWQDVICQQQKHVLYVTCRHLYDILIQQHQQEGVCEFITQLLSPYGGSSLGIITFHTYIDYCTEHNVTSVNSHIKHLYTQYIRVSALTSVYDSEVECSGSTAVTAIKLIHKLRKQLPDISTTTVLCKLLTAPHHSDVHQETVSYFKQSSSDKKLRDKVLVQLVQLLEHKDASVRQGSCLALVWVKGSECCKQLRYLYQCDTSDDVRQAAKQTITSLGYFADVNIYHYSPLRQTVTPTIGIY